MGLWKTPIVDLGNYLGNHLWVKREDLIPFSFGGNKARKAELFFREIDEGDYDCVVTYGSGSSNHCRVVANACCQRGLSCYVICPEEASEESFNSLMVRRFGAEFSVVPTHEVHDTIERKLYHLKEFGRRPYFIAGGGHGNIGTEAYVQCYREIKAQENEMGVRFDYVFFASGTGTTQAGLICGQLMEHDERTIVGISIARKNPHGRNVVLDSAREYTKGAFSERELQAATHFVDDYASGYGVANEQVLKTIDYALKTYGIPLDTTYTGKAFMGMSEYLKEIRNKNVLFIHTGGTPLFFDALLDSR